MTDFAEDNEEDAFIDNRATIKQDPFSTQPKNVPPVNHDVTIITQSNVSLLLDTTDNVMLAPAKKETIKRNKFVPRALLTNNSPGTLLSPKSSHSPVSTRSQPKSPSIS